VAREADRERKGQTMDIEQPRFSATIIDAYSVKPRNCPVSVERYELRVYDTTRGPYVRSRRDGYNPVTIAGILSGSDAPKWMCHLQRVVAEAVSGCDSLADAVSVARGIQTAERKHAKMEIAVPVTVRGRMLWKRNETGPRGGHQVWYAERRDGQNRPNRWELWSSTARNAGGYASSAGTFPHAGLYR